MKYSVREWVSRVAAPVALMVCALGVGLGASAISGVGPSWPGYRADVRQRSSIIAARAFWRGVCR